MVKGDKPKGKVMHKIVFNGWVYKQAKASEILNYLRKVTFKECIDRTKGNREKWGDNWPPHRVTVTVEMKVED